LFGRRQIGGLAEGQFVQRLVEIVQRRSGHAIGVEPEEDLVDVELEDLVLRERRLDAQCQDGFLDLAVPGLLGGEEEVLRHLLGDGRAAALDGIVAFDARHDVVAQRADHAVHGDTRVAVEVFVFGRDEGVDDQRRDGFDRLEQPAFACVLGQQRAVRRVDARRYRRLIVLQHGVIGQRRIQLVEIDCANRNGTEGAEHAETEEPAEKSEHQMVNLGADATDPIG
jgi:hypothetical protein